MIISVLLLTMPRLHSFIQKQPPASFRESEWIVFLAQLQIDFRQADSAAVREGKIQLRTKEPKVVAYTSNGRQLIRTVNGAGNEITLQNLLKIECEVSAHVLKVHVVDRAGTVHTSIVTRFMPLEEEL